MTLEEFFADRDEARALFEVLRAEIATLGDAEVHVSKSQVAFWHDHNVAVAWTPDRYRKSTAPLVLTISLRRHDPSPRWKQVARVSSGRYTHHLELRSAEQIDDEVRGWLAEAWAIAEGAR
mgnify:CR=1 FL=1